MKFKENFKKLRITNNLTQEELAKLLNINLEKVRRYEQGKQKTIDINDIENLIKIFKCDYNTLFE